MDDKLNIVEIVIQLMEQTENIINLSGEEKKNVVLDNLQTIIGKEAYDNYYYLIINVIDFAIGISKGKKLNLNNLKKLKLFSCCKI
jgi:hypothetical protein